MIDSVLIVGCGRDQIARGKLVGSSNATHGCEQYVCLDPLMCAAAVLCLFKCEKCQVRMLHLDAATKNTINVVPAKNINLVVASIRRHS